jgi:hypothetical protein
LSEQFFHPPSLPSALRWGNRLPHESRQSPKYCDEAYAIIDAIDSAKKKRALDAGKLDAFLAGLRKTNRTATRAGGRHG